MTGLLAIAAGYAVAGLFWALVRWWEKNQGRKPETKP